MDEVNDAISRRIRTVPFITKAVDQEIYDILEDRTNINLINPYYKTDEFQDDFKQALFLILLERFKIFHERGNVLMKVPDSCKEKAKDYLATCDDIFSWFIECFVPITEGDEDEPIHLSSIYKVFSSSKVFNDMSKSDQRYPKRIFRKD
jgi:hypothetical protein